MKKLFIVANWKAHKTKIETDEWFQEMSKNREFLQSLFEEKQKTIILCSPYHELHWIMFLIQTNKLQIELGAQDVSAFPVGAYTGEIPAELLRQYATHVILGHSERRTNLNESDELLQKKVERAKEYGLDIVYCVQGIETTIPSAVSTVAYEPIEAIGSGHADSPDDAEKVAKEIKDKNPQVQSVLYGGSVNEENVHSFTSLPSVDGVLVGGASLDAVSFMQIIKNA